MFAIIKWLPKQDPISQRDTCQIEHHANLLSVRKLEFIVIKKYLLVVIGDLWGHVNNVRDIRW